MSAVVALGVWAPAAALAHGVFVFGGAGRGMGGLLYLVFGAFAAVLVVSIISFFVRSRVFFWIALCLAVLALLAGGLILGNLIGMGGPVAVIPLGAALLSLALVLGGRWRNPRRQKRAPEVGP